MNNKEINKQIKDIDAQLAALEKEEKQQNKVVVTVTDQTFEAIESLKEVVEEINAIEDLKTFKNNDEQTYRNMLLTVVSWFSYLKREKSDSAEYEEAKNLVMSIGAKHAILNNWCKDVVENSFKVDETLTINNAELNVSESNEYVVNEDLKIVFDVEQAKEFINDLKSVEKLNSRVLDYKIVYKGTEYTCHHYFDNYKPKWETTEGCPFVVLVVEAKTDEKGNYIVVFNITEKN